MKDSPGGTKENGMPCASRVRPKRPKLQSPNAKDACIPFRAISNVFNEDNEVANFQSFIKDTCKADPVALEKAPSCAPLSVPPLSLPSGETEQAKASDASAPRAVSIDDPFEHFEKLSQMNTFGLVVAVDDFAAAGPAMGDVDTGAADPLHSEQLPLDWTLKMELHIQSPHDFNWLREQKEMKRTAIEPLSLSNFTSDVSSFCPSLDVCEPVKTWEKISRLYECLYYWVFPFDADVSSITVNGALNAAKAGPLAPEQQQPSLWESALQSAYNSILVKKTRYMYMIHGDMNALFLLDAKHHIEARLRVFDRRIIKMLEAEGFIDMERDGSTSPRSGDDGAAKEQAASETMDVLREMEELEKHHPGQYDEVIEHPCPMVVRGKERALKLVHFLKHVLGKSSICPVIISHRAFEGATLRKNQLKIQRSVRRISVVSAPDTARPTYQEDALHKISVFGLVLPSSLQRLFYLLKSTQLGEYEASLSSDANTTGFNMQGPPEGGQRFFEDGLYMKRLTVKNGLFRPDAGRYSTS